MDTGVAVLLRSRISIASDAYGGCAQPTPALRELDLASLQSKHVQQHLFIYNRVRHQMAMPILAHAGWIQRESSGQCVIADGTVQLRIGRHGLPYPDIRILLITYLDHRRLQLLPHVLLYCTSLRAIALTSALQPML